MWKSHQKRLSWPNWIATYFFKVSPPFQSQSQQKLQGFGIWHSEGEVAPDCTKSNWKCSSLGLLQEPGTEQVPDVQHPTAPAGTDSGAVEPTPARDLGWPHWEGASQQFLSAAQRHHRLSQLENSVLWLILFTSNQLLRGTSLFSPNTVMCHSWNKGLHIVEWSPHFQHQQADQKKNNFTVNWCLIKLMTHILWIARSCHFSQSSLDTQSKRTWEDLHPASPQGKWEVFAEAVKHPNCMLQSANKLSNMGIKNLRLWT